MPAEHVGARRFLIHQAVATAVMVGVLASAGCASARIAPQSESPGVADTSVSPGPISEQPSDSIPDTVASLSATPSDLQPKSRLIDLVGTKGATGISVVVQSERYPSSVDPAKSGAADDYLVATITISDDVGVFAYDPAQFSFVADDGQTYAPVGLANVDVAVRSLGIGSLDPGTSVTGYVAFDGPPSNGELTMVVAGAGDIAKWPVEAS